MPPIVGKSAGPGQCPNIRRKAAAATAPARGTSTPGGKGTQTKATVNSPSPSNNKQAIRKPAAIIQPSCMAKPSSDAPKKVVHDKRVLVVDVPSAAAHDDDVEPAQGVKRNMSFVAPRVYRDEDVEEAARHGWLSGPCDCCLSLWAGLGDIIEGGADQVVGLALLLLSSGFTYFITGGYRTLWTTASADGDGGPAPPAPPHLPDWSYLMVHQSSVYAQVHPATFVGALLGSLCLIALAVLFEEDMRRYVSHVKASMRGYAPLEKPITPYPDGNGGGAGGNADLTKQQRAMRFMRERTLRQELGKAVDAAEELDLELRMQQSSASNTGNGDAGAAADDEARQEKLKALQMQQARRQSLQDALANTATTVDSPELRRHAPRGADDCCGRVLNSVFMHVLRRSLNGLVVIWLYFADVISDIEVMLLLHSAGHVVYAAVAGSLLCLQFVAVYSRVLPYLHATFGRRSLPYQLFLWLGLPIGMILLDFLMFLEPFGLLTILPFPPWMKQFLPAYKATRVIAEVLIESLPQCLLQSYILITVYHHVNGHTQTAAETRLLNAALGGTTFSEVLPRSITISVITMLKTWIELVYSAREAGISVRTKVAHLWHVGHGLPLEALKKGSITGWSCAYRLSDGEVMPLLDALLKNSSLTRLDLAEAGLEWSGPDAHKARTGGPLIEAMATSAQACSNLQCLVISHESSYEIPVAKLRAGGDAALTALREAPILRAGGPRRLELLTMSDLLRKNRRTTAAEAHDIEGSAKGVASLVEASRAGKLSLKGWEEELTSLMVAGETRRAHFKSLLGASVLRAVGFAAETLLTADFGLEELKAGGYEAKELLRVGCSQQALSELGYTALELREAGLSVSDLRRLQFSAADLRAIGGDGLSAVELKSAGYKLPELAAAGYGVSDLKEADYSVSELRAVGFTAELHRVDRAFGVAMLREGGYLAGELQKAGFECKLAQGGGYTALEATQGGWPLKELMASGYTLRDLRRAGHSALEMRQLGVTLPELRDAEYSPAELQDAGYDAAELKSVGTSLAQLRAANTPIKTLKEAGYKPSQLKQHGYGAKELADGGYTAKELRGFLDTLYVDGSGSTYAGYTAKDLRENGDVVHYSATQLKDAGYTASELKTGGWPAGDLRKKGFVAAELLAGNYSAGEMRIAGYKLSEIRVAKNVAASLRASGAPAAELKAAGFNAKELFEGGYDTASLFSVGFAPAELMKAGFKPRQLADGCGLRVGELLDMGFEVVDLRLAGFPAKALFDDDDDYDGVTGAELLAAGYTSREVEALGKAVSVLRAQKYAAAELKFVGYSAGELRAGGYSEDALLAAGFQQHELPPPPRPKKVQSNQLHA